MKFFENGMMSRLFTNVDVGIDLGTANLRLYLKGRGVVFDEPSVVAVDRSSGKVVAVGRRAHEMLGKTPDHIEVVHPLRGGVVADYEACQGMLNTVLTRIVGRNLFFKPRVMVCIPTEITSVERRAVLEACTQAGAAKTLLIEAPLAAAIGAGMHHERPDGKGYPKGMKGEELPLVARIIGVADTFDAMYSNRPYRNRMPFDKVVSIIKEVRGTQLDSEVVDAFLSLVDKGVLKDVDDKTAGALGDGDMPEDDNS